MRATTRDLDRDGDPDGAGAATPTVADMTGVADGITAVADGRDAALGDDRLPRRDAQLRLRS
jgi:hypothetical protein